MCQPALNGSNWRDAVTSSAIRWSTAIFLMLGLPALAAAQSVPDVIGPIPANLPPGTDLTHNYPQLASEPNFDLSSRGYIEEEFFFQVHRDAIPGSAYCQWTRDVHGRCDRAIHRESVQDSDARQAPSKSAQF